MSEESGGVKKLTTTGMLGVAFVVLKLNGTINWSWWFVTCPFWANSVILFIAQVIDEAYKTLNKTDGGRGKQGE